MKVLLVNPPRSPANAILDHAPKEALPFVHRRLVGPPLGLLTLAAAVPDHQVELLEMKGEYDLDPAAPPPAELLRRRLEESRPQAVGVTFIASEFPAGLDLLRVVKAWDPSIVTLAGGLHATLCPEDFDHPAVDAVLRGPSVGSFRAFLRAVESGGQPEGIGGLLRRKEGRLAPAGPPDGDCDPAGADYVPPDRSLLKPWLSTYVVGKAPGPSTYVFTSLGCPFRCSFCSIWPQYGGAYHQRDVDSVIEELKTLDEYPVVRFADGNTLVDLGFAERLFERIAAEGIDKTFIMDIRVDTAAGNPALIRKLARGGLKVAITGFESFREEELRAYGKGYKPDRIGRAVRVFHDNGIHLRGNYLIPPDYGEGDFDALEEFASRHSVAFAGYTILTPMPGTAFHREVEDRIVDRDLGKYNFFNCVLRTSLPLERFYERAGALWRIRLGTETI